MKFSFTLLALFSSSILFAFSRSIIQPYSLQDISQVKGSPYYEMARVVAHQQLDADGGSFYCTGFRVAKSLFLTNYHCFMRSHQFRYHPGDRNCAFVMGRETGNSERPAFRCVGIVASDRKLDFILMRVEENPAPEAKFPIAKLSSRAVRNAQALILPGHPGIQLKQIDVSPQCQITTAEPFEDHERINIQHQCDTIGGSSGSPMIDKKTGVVVGLHWGGAIAKQNHGIPMSLLVEHLAQFYPTILSELRID